MANSNHPVQETCQSKSVHVGLLVACEQPLPLSRHPQTTVASLASPSSNHSGAGEVFADDMLAPQQEVGGNYTSVLVTGISGRGVCRNQ